MARHYQSPEALCPFYRGEEANEIFCEAPLSNATLSLYFKSGATKHKRSLCRYDWPQCPIARMLWAMYDDIGEMRNMAALKNRNGLHGLPAREHYRWEKENRP